LQPFGQPVLFEGIPARYARKHHNSHGNSGDWLVGAPTSAPVVATANHESAHCLN